MYQVLYRKYRPKRFQDVTGQEHITTTLKNEIISGKISHAYLFTGSRGTGKTTCAKIMAKAVNCAAPIDGDPCGNCNVCCSIDKGSILDVVEIDAASNNGVDNIRNLIEESSLVPVEAKYRVYIIDEVHMLSVGAFNALLKTLEEPPEHVIFILATTEVHKLPATILSRCQRFNFYRISAEKISERLQNVAQNEGYTLEPDASYLIARLSDGSLRDALSILDQCLTKSGSIISLADVENISGLTNFDYMIQIMESIAQSDISSIIHIIDKLYTEAKSISRLSEELILFFRDIILFKVDGNISTFCFFTPNGTALLQKIAKNFSIEDATNAINILISSQTKFSSSHDAKTTLELDLINICNFKSSTKISNITDLSEFANSLTSLANRVSVLEHKYAVPSHTVPINTSKLTQSGASHKKSDNINQNIQPSDDKQSIEPILDNKSSEFTDWNKIIDELKKESRSFAISLKNSKVQVDGTSLILYVNDIAQNMLNNAERRARLSELISKITSVNYKIILKKLDHSIPQENITQNTEKSSSDTALDSFIEDLTNSGVDFNITD